MRVLVTGAGGNLGSKLRAHLEGSDWCEAILALDIRTELAGGKTEWIACDLRDPRDSRWIAAAERADAIVHFATENPMPWASWAEVALGFDMLANLLSVAADHPCRFLFASSNHAMGGYKDVDPPGGTISGETPPLPGTRTFNGVDYVTSTAYGAGKLLGERAVAAAAAAAAGLTAVNLRIGWCQSGENRPETIAAHGSAARGTKAQPEAELERDLRWFRNMWLSNRDYVALMEAALRAPAKDWPGPSLTVAGVSNNRGTLWDLETGRRYLGYEPKDDIWAALDA